ncbi:hypothetical protein C7212DRAFT_343029 [Tuber magnatum]|uniref:Uncharacterized protein n=1 Tax=Tuber magnatum TaxID=42249 RepID=A0A317SRZ6_9PEZI|nr:hypothetical protein C7212DRAFT_343029 [Tuber magnatum]
MTSPNAQMAACVFCQTFPCLPSEASQPIVRSECTILINGMAMRHTVGLPYEHSRSLILLHPQPRPSNPPPSHWYSSLGPPSAIIFYFLTGSTNLFITSTLRTSLKVVRWPLLHLQTRPKASLPQPSTNPSSMGTHRNLLRLQVPPWIRPQCLNQNRYPSTRMWPPRKVHPFMNSNPITLTPPSLTTGNRISMATTVSSIAVTSAINVHSARQRTSKEALGGLNHGNDADTPGNLDTYLFESHVVTINHNLSIGPQRAGILGTLNRSLPRASTQCQIAVVWKDGVRYFV